MKEGRAWLFTSVSSNQKYFVYVSAPIPKIVYEDFDESFPGFDESSVQSEHHTEYTESIPESPATDRILNLSNSDLQDLPTDNVRLTVMEPQKTGG